MHLDPPSVMQSNMFKLSSKFYTECKKAVLGPFSLFVFHVSDLSSLFLATLWSLAGKGLTSCLCCLDT